MNLIAKSLTAIIYASSFLAISAHAVENSGVSAETNPLARGSQWLRVPIVIRPIERITVRDFKGATSESLVNHPVTTHVLTVQNGHANEL